MSFLSSYRSTFLSRHISLAYFSLSAKEPLFIGLFCGMSFLSSCLGTFPSSFIEMCFQSEKREFCKVQRRENCIETRGEKTHIPQKSPINSDSFAEREKCMRNMSPERILRVQRRANYRVAKTHRMPYLIDHFPHISH